MAEFVELGSGGAWPDGERNPASHLVIADDGSALLVDCGSGTTAALARAGVQPRELEAVVLTHIHIDHCADLASLAFSAFLTGRTNPLMVYGPEGVAAMVDSLFSSTYPFAPKMMQTLRGVALDVRGNELSERDGVQVASSFTLTPYRVKHPIATYGYRIEVSEKTIAFSGDTEPCDALVELARSADILVQDCAWTDENGPRPGHCIPSQIAEIAAEAGPATVVLHHMFPPCKGHEQEMVDSVRSKYSGKVIMGHDQMRISI